jgi:glycogen operon protein
MRGSFLERMAVIVRPESRFHIFNPVYMPRTYTTEPGRRHPEGATPDPKGTNFCIFTRYATGVELLLYERASSPNPFQVIGLDPAIHRTFFWWHVYVQGLPPGIHYTWRLDGPTDPVRGLRFDRRRELLDPWAHAVTDFLWDRRRACSADGAGRTAMRAVVLGDGYAWEGDQPFARPEQDAIIYELHVGGFTRHPSARVTHPGTFGGLAEKISYLKELGITDVELLPVMAFDSQDVAPGVAAQGLGNFWGYSPHSFYSPHPGYCISAGNGTHRKEFRDLVKALHHAGLGVILDVVFNHTAEGGAQGPVINFKGFGHTTFYHVDPNNKNIFRDYTGCGNTINCNHPVVTRFLVECLEYWVNEMHVDGFRFDLASVFARGEDGTPLANAPLPWSIEASDSLAYTKLIAEAWDAAGLYQVGEFPGLRWAEWNGRYRDAIRRFVRGERGMLGEVATRLAGSSDLYEPEGRLPVNSINFITCHDGFTLEDLVSYDRKHNEANGEENRDGTNENYSWNCGVEGPTTNPHILSLRRRQAKNFMAILLLSQGVPMILAGDEVGRTQQGNNNAYCQDNEISWFDWRLVEQNRDMLRFVKQMIAFRKRHPCLRRRKFLTGQRPPGARLPDVTWHGVRLRESLWDDPNAQLLAYTLGGLSEAEEDVHVVLNMSNDALEVALPDLAGRRWHRAIDTWLPSPDDIQEPGRQPRLAALSCKVAPRSVVVLESRPAG